MVSKKSVLLLRLLLYILVLGFALAQLFFYGILMLIPMDLLLLSAEKNANVWGFLIPFFIGSLALYYLHKIKTTSNLKFAHLSQKYSVGIGLLLNIIVSGILLLIFVQFTKYNQEPWLIQGGWFMRLHGIIWSMVLGTLVFTGIQIIDEVLRLKALFESNFNLKIGKAKWGFTIEAIVSLFTLVFTLLFSGFLLLLYRVSTLFGAFLFTFVLLTAFSILFIGTEGIQFPFQYKITQNIPPVTDKSVLDESRKKKNARISVFFLSISSLSLIIMILYFLDIKFIYPYPPGVNANRFIFPIQQPLTIVLGVFVGIVVIAGFSRFILRNSVFGEIKPTSNEQVNKIIRALFGIIIFTGVLFILIILGLALYIFEFTLYLPQVISYTFIWAVVGVIIFIVIEKLVLKPNLKQTLSFTMIFIAFLLVITNFWNLALDLSENSQSISSGVFDIYFPFEFLFSNKNIIMMGSSMGFLLSFLMKTLMNGLLTTDMSKYANSASIFFFFLAPIAIGCLIGFSSLLINLPGGDPTLAMYSSDSILPIIRIGIFLVLGLVLIRFNIVAARRDKNEISKKEAVPQQLERDNLKNALVSSNLDKTGTKVKASVLISIFLVSIISGGLGAIIGVASLNARSIPVLNSTSGYDLWIANSSERFNHQTKIAVSTSPQIEEVAFNMAKNEYYAFQIGLTLKSKDMYLHSYYLTDFEGIENSSEVISSDYARLRYEDYILQEEFPDKLLPIEEKPILLQKRLTHMFWFDIRTPYNLTTGHYAGILRITFQLGDKFFEEKIPIRFYVWDFAIPLQKHVTTSVGDASVSDAIYDKLVENWFSHRFNMYAEDIRGTDDYRVFEIYNGERYIYYLNKSDGSITFNWTLWDQKIGALLNVTNAPMNGIRIDYSLGRSLKIGNETENQWFLNWLVKVEQHLELKGWLNICYYYFVDEFTLFIPDEYESRAAYYEAVEAQLASIKSVAPKIRILAIAPPLPDLESIKPYIDIYCPLSYDRDVDLWEKAKQGGKEMWFYTCIGPFAPYPNVHLYNRLFETRLQMWNAWYWDMDGYLFWRANSFNHGQYGFGYNSWGDGWFIYIDQEKNRIYDSIRWENLGDGQEDYEMFWLLNATLNELDNLALLSQNEIESYRNELTAIIDKVADNFIDYTNNPHDIYNGIERIGQILHSLSSIIDIKAIGEAPWFPISGVSP